MSTMVFRIVVAEMPDRGKLLKVGWVAWDEHQVKEDRSPASAPNSIKEQWRTSRMALSPLMDWLHQIEGMNWPEVPQARSNLCQLEKE
jgi:hypothetical protein